MKHMRKRYNISRLVCTWVGICILSIISSNAKQQGTNRWMPVRDSKGTTPAAPNKILNSHNKKSRVIGCKHRMFFFLQ